MRQLRTIGFILLVSLLLECTAVKPSPIIPTEVIEFADKPKNIILMIGDGMGLAQITTALYSNDNRLNLERFPVVGLQKTAASDNLVTDSAAAATAMASGVKTYFNAIGMDRNVKPVQTILEECEDRGLSTGFVVTSSMVHATPAAFYAHQKYRALYEKIAEDMLVQDIDYMIGGGKKYFTNRTDQKNLYSILESNNYQVRDYFRDELSELILDDSQKFIYFTANGDPLPASQGRNYLPYASSLGANFLKKHSKGNGFFMLVEGSQIDWGGHSNNKNQLITELLDFDRTIGEILKFASQDKETLVIVTADHETGGLAIQPKSKMNKLRLAFTTKVHTATMVPVFAFGPRAELFNGVYENTEIHTKMRQALGFSEMNGTY